MQGTNIITEDIFAAPAYNERGQITDYTLGNQLTTTRGYNDFGMSTLISTPGIQNLQYDFDAPTGNLKSRTDVLKGLQEGFTYDDLLKNRLKTWKINTAVADTALYKTNGNIDTKTGLGSFAYSGTQPHAVSGVDNTDNIISSTTQTIDYTAFNKVELIEEVDEHKLVFTYGPDQQRKKTQLYKWVNSAWQLQKTKYFVGGIYEEEKDETTGTTTENNYINAGDGLAAIFTNNNLYYIHTDYLGSYQSISNSSGALVEELSYGPWGRRRKANNWQDYNLTTAPMFARGFTGHEHLPEFNLINMNGRVYDPILGKFLSPDNYIQMPDYTQNLNRYSYCLNNPLIYTDPSGESFLATLAIIWAGNYVIGWLDNVINKGMSAKDAFRNTSFVMGVNFSPADFNNQNHGVSHPQADAHNIAKREEELSGELDAFIVSQRGKGRQKGTWMHTVREGQNHAGISREYYGLFNWMDIQKLNPEIDVYNGGQPLPAGAVLQVPGPISTLGVSGMDTPGVPEGKRGGLFQLAGQLILDSPHSPLYGTIKPGELKQNRAYYNSQLGYYEWSWHQDGIMEISNFANYTYHRGTWRGVYHISTGYYNQRGQRVWYY